MKTVNKLMQAFEIFRPHINGHKTAMELFFEAVREVEELEKKVNTLPIGSVSQQRELLAISCLKNITDPIKYLKELAEADGCKLDGTMAIHMTRNGMFYQDLANKALKEINNCG